MTERNSVTMNLNEPKILPTIVVNDSAMGEAENLWCKIIDNIEDSETKRISSNSKSSSKKSLKSTKSLSLIEKKDVEIFNDNFTGLPFNKTINDTTPIKMINMPTRTSKIPRFMVAPDGYIPNSNVRQNYPLIFNCDPPQKKKKLRLKGEEDDFIKLILSKHLAPDKITEVKKRLAKRTVKAIKKTHYESSNKDIINIQNEVINHFNFELEQALSETITVDEPLKKVKKKKPSKPIFLMPSKATLKSFKPVTLQAEMESRIIDSLDEVQTEAAESTEDIDIDILDTLAKQIEEGDKQEITQNKKIYERIVKDRKLRMNEDELQRCLKFLEGLYGCKKEMYKEIMKALNKKKEALEVLETFLTSRRKRLEFLNTLTDPQHLFDYLLQFYEERPKLVDNIQDLLMGCDSVNMKQLTRFCGEQYKIQEFFAEFVIVKNYANTILSTKFQSEKDRILVLERCLRDEIISEKIVFDIFMSSENDAKRFFQCITECKLKEMTAIIANMKEIKDMQESISVNFTKTVTTSSPSSDPKPTVITIEKKQVKIEKSLTITLPPLPEYNEFSWKHMMSQYITQMLFNISPSGTLDGEAAKTYVENANLQGLMKELSFLHAEVLRLLNVYLNNDAVSAKKLLDGLIAEDELAYQALIELIGEKEAMQIIKSLRLKQAKVIEKIIECHGNQKQMSDAKHFLRGMMHNLPPSLTSNLDTWLNAGQVSSADINRAVTLLSEKNIPLRIHGTVNEKDEVGSRFFSNTDKRSRASVTPADLSQEEKDEFTVGPRRKRSASYNVDYEYRDIPIRDTSVEGILSNADARSNQTADQVSYPSSTFSDVDDKQNLPMDPSSPQPMAIDPVSQKAEQERLIEFNACQEICKTAWFSAAPTENYADLMVKLVAIMGASKDKHNIEEMKAAMQMIAERSTDKRPNVVIAEQLIRQVVSLLEKDDMDQNDWQKKLSSLGLEDITDLVLMKSSKLKLDEVKTINFDKVVKSEISMSLEESIRSSYEKQLQIKRLIEILRSYEAKKAQEMLKAVQNKQFICPLFVPEFNQHISAVRDLGMDYYNPHELIEANPNVIMRKNNEELRRTRIKSKILEERSQRAIMVRTSHEAFWEKASISSRIRDPNMIADSLSIPEKSSSGSLDLATYELDRSASQDDWYNSPIVPREYEEEIFPELKLVTPVFKRVSETSIMTFKDAMSVKQFRKKGEIFTAEYVEEDVIIPDDISMKYETCTTHEFIMKKPRRNRSKDPHFDFHSLYGNNAYYLPYIAPEIRKRHTSREDAFPTYSSTDERDNLIYDNVHNLINRDKKSSVEGGTVLTNSRFLRRPSFVPLKDWIKLGAPRMATNMVVADKSYKIDNSKCPYHHLAKLGLHRYGLSATKFIERVDMLEFISKANSATKHEKVKSKLDSKISDSSKSSIEIF